MVKVLVCAWLCMATAAHAATVTELKATFRKGQTFITFKQLPDTRVTYNVYRSNSPIATTAGLHAVATLEPDSGTNRYTGKGFIIEDLGAALSATTGLLVYTPKESGAFYYAVTNSTDDRLVAGTNATTSGVTEAPSETPGAVLLEPPSPECGGACRIYKYYAWEDVSTWRQDAWGYYGHRFNVIVPIGYEGVEPPYPLSVFLHAAGDNGYKEPFGWGRIPHSVIVLPVDLAFFGMNDPYGGSGRNYSRWFGYFDAITGFAEPVTERRIVRYVKLVRDDAEFRVDPTRISVFGASMGGGGAMHLASHYPTLFASAMAQIGWPNMDAWGGSAEFPPGTRVGDASGPLVTDYQNIAWMAAHTTLSPIIHAFNKDDPAINESSYPETIAAFERFHQPFMAQWKNGGHAQYPVPDQWDYLRFKSDEAYPAFANASTSDALEVQEGQRNAHLDWSSAVHSLGDGTGIVDTPQSFSMTFAAARDATADVTIRNAQQFRPPAGETIEWRNVAQDSGQVLQSGSVAADAAGLVTVRVQIRAAKSRLTLSCSKCTAAALAPASPARPLAPRNVRIVP